MIVLSLHSEPPAACQSDLLGRISRTSNLQNSRHSDCILFRRRSSGFLHKKPFDSHDALTFLYAHRFIMFFVAKVAGKKSKFARPPPYSMPVSIDEPRFQNTTGISYTYPKKPY